MQRQTYIDFDTINIYDSNNNNIMLFYINLFIGTFIYLYYGDQLDNYDVLQKCYYYFLVNYTVLVVSNMIAISILYVLNVKDYMKILYYFNKFNIFIMNILICIRLLSYLVYV
jgi:hypothetical protein